MLDVTTRKTKDFIWGTINTLEDISLPDGAASKSKNWLTNTDKIELRRGYAILGDLVAGTGKITGFFVAKRRDGTEIAFRTRGKKLEYLLSDVWTEIGTNVLGTAADGKDISFAQYSGPAGDQLFINSPYGPYLKIMLANPGSYSTMYDSSINFKGYIKIKLNRTFLFGRLKDRTSVRVSFIDSQSYTDVSAENVGTGDGSETNFTDTLAYRAAGAKRTCFGIVATDGTETFTDNHDGTLTGDKGGSGTINYTTGAIALSFATAPSGAQAITCDHSWEDSTDDGICDFTESGTRLAGEGALFLQNDGGNIMAPLNFGDTEYCIHEFNIWALTIGADDTEATNLIFRKGSGMPNWLAGIETDEGIFYIDYTNKKDPHGRVVTLDKLTGEKVALSVSQGIKYKNKYVGIDLSDYRFNKAVTKAWGDYIIFAFRTSGATENDTCLVYNKVRRTLDLMDYWISCMDVYDGALIAGDPSTNNVYTLFSGTDDDEALISNYWEGNLSDLQIEGLKKSKKMTFRGEIGPDQIIRVSVYIDNSTALLVTDIKGDGAYVDKDQAISVGAITIGKNEVGGGSAGITAYNFEREVPFNQDKFSRAKIRFEAIGIGYASITQYAYKDIRLKSRKVPEKYRS